MESIPYTYISGGANSIPYTFMFEGSGGANSIPYTFIFEGSGGANSIPYTFIFEESGGACLRGVVPIHLSLRYSSTYIYL